jgi:phosphohistidine phosphatase
MVEHGIVPDVVLCSSAVRTRQTLTAMLPVLGGQPRVSYEDGLYLAAPRTLLARLHKVAADRATVLLVGHNPGLHELAAELAGDGGGKPGKRLRDTMPTAALAVFELEGGWSGLGREETRLVHYVTPKELERDA